MNKEDICLCGISVIEIHINGDVFVCNPEWCKKYSFGNIFEDSIEEIINGERAKAFRKSIISKDYEYCNTELCFYSTYPEEKLDLIIEKDGTLKKWPSEVRFCTDRACNVRCIYCRDNHRDDMDREKTKKLDELIETHFIPLLKDAKVVQINAKGEVFCSSHSKKLIKRVTEVYPDIKFEILSNGILFDEKNCAELGILDKIKSATISIHSIYKKTYDKLVLDGDYEAVWKNINWLVGMKNQGRVGSVDLCFVISSLNYKEMKPFLQKAIDLGIKVNFWEYYRRQSKLAERYDEMAIWQPTHKEHKKFVKIISDDIFLRTDDFNMPEFMYALRRPSRLSKFKKFFKK